jgi:hypothetical protein
MSAMELDGDVAAHPPSSPVSMASPISTPIKQPSPRGGKRRELSDDADLGRTEQASRAHPIKKEKNEEVVDEDKQAKKKERERKKREKEEKRKMKKVRKQKKQEQRMKRKLEKEKAIARALILLRMPESVLDTEQVCPIPLRRPLWRIAKDNILSSQKEDNNTTSGPAVPGPAVSDTEQVCHMRSSHLLLRNPETDIHLPSQKKDDSNLSDAAVLGVRQVCLTLSCYRFLKKSEADSHLGLTEGER